MAQLLVRNLENVVKTKLQRRARRNGRSVEEEVREILRDATKTDGGSRRELGSEIAGLFRGTGIQKEIPEWHDIDIELPDFGG